MTVVNKRTAKYIGRAMKRGHVHAALRAAAVASFLASTSTSTPSAFAILGHLSRLGSLS
jgi:hypothetical protein